MRRYIFETTIPRILLVYCKDNGAGFTRTSYAFWFDCDFFDDEWGKVLRFNSGYLLCIRTCWLVISSDLRCDGGHVSQWLCFKDSDE